MQRLKRLVRILVSAMLFGALAGCFSTAVSPIYHESIHKSYKYDWSATVLSGEAPYKIAWQSDLNGDQPAPGADSLVLVDHGAYRSWTWHVEATPEVAAWWTDRQSIDAGSSTGQEDVQLNWEEGFRRLYSVTEYLLGEDPLPVDVTMRLYPRGTGLRDSITLTDDHLVPIRIANSFPAPSDSADLEVERSHDFREALAAVGGLLQHVELAKGVTDAPNDSAARQNKDYANSACWLLSVRPALALGSDDAVIGVPSSVGSAAVRMAKAVAKSYPDDKLSSHYYSAVLVMSGLNDYLDHLGIQSPQAGSDTKPIQSMLRYCRAFVHYSGDVRQSSMPINQADSAPSFEINRG